MNADSISKLIEEVLKTRQLPNLLSRDSFIDNLFFLYHTMKASETLLEIAAQKAEGSLAEYYRVHLEEERGHHKWLAEDLKSADVDVEDSSAPLYAEMLVGMVYYRTLHQHPAALLGYMLLMEGNPSNMMRVGILESLHGKQLVRTLRYHAEHDVDHGSRLKEVINSLPEEQLFMVQTTAYNSAQLFSLGMSLIASKERATYGLG